MVGEMVEFEPNTEIWSVGIVLRAWYHGHGPKGETYWLECLWDDGIIEGIDSTEVSFVRREK